MVRTKPTVGGWQAPTETDPSALKTTGYSNLEAPKPSDFNWLFNRFSEWNEYNKIAANGAYHVDVATGNDTTGDGSSGSPWATIDKALSELPETGIVNIYLYGAGTVYTVSADVTIYCSVNILNAAAQTAKINFGSYGGGGADNEKYTITMVNGYFNVLTVTESTVIDAPDAAEVWAVNSTVFALQGESGVSFYSELTFETTVTTPGSDYYSFIRGTGLNTKGLLKFNTYSSVNISGSDAYIFEASNSICQLGASDGTCDDESLIMYDPIYQNDILHIEFVAGSQAPVVTGGTGGNFTIGFGGYIDVVGGTYNSVESTVTIAYDANGTTIRSAISGISNIPMTAKSIDVTSNAGAILNFDVELYGSSEGEMSPDITSLANSITGGDVADHRWWYKQRASKKILNLIEGYSINKLTV